MKRFVPFIFCLSILVSCSHYQEQKKPEALASYPITSRATASAADSIDYTDLKKAITPLLSQTFSEYVAVPNITKEQCNINGTSGTVVKRQSVLDAIKYTYQLAKAKCGDNCTGVYNFYYDNIKGLGLCTVVTTLNAPGKNAIQKKLEALVNQIPEARFEAVYRAKGTFEQCNSTGTTSTTIVSQDVLRTADYAKNEVLKKCGDNCETAVSFTSVLEGNFSYDCDVKATAWKRK